MMISGVEYDNCKRWKHFLSSLQKSPKGSRSEKTNDLFLGNIDCFSTNLSRRLLKRCDETIPTELPHWSLKKNKTTPANFKYSTLERIPKTEKEAAGSTETIYEREPSKSREMKLKEEYEDKEASDDTNGDIPDGQFSSIETDKISDDDDDDDGDDDESPAFFGATEKKTVTSSSSTSQDTSGKDLESIQSEYSMDTPVPKINETRATLPSGGFQFLNENVKTTRHRKRNKFDKSIKKDVDIPSSDWTVMKLADYVDFKTSVGEIRFKERVRGIKKKKIVSRALKQIKSVQRVIFRGNTPCLETARSDGYDLSRIRGTEADIRILLDAILIPFAEGMKLTIQTEKSYKNSNLPGCKFDYSLHYGEYVVGLVEAKNRLHGNGLGPESVVQGILQLAALQAEVYGKSIKARPTEKCNPLPFFNIISDGYRYVFVQLDHKKLLFDHQPGRTEYGDDMPILKFHEMNSKESTMKILEQMAKLLFQAKHSIAGLDKNNEDDQDDSKDGDKDDDENDDEDDDENDDENDDKDDDENDDKDDDENDDEDDDENDDKDDDENDDKDDD